MRSVIREHEELGSLPSSAGSLLRAGELGPALIRVAELAAAMDRTGELEVEHRDVRAPAGRTGDNR